MAQENAPATGLLVSHPHLRESGSGLGRLSGDLRAEATALNDAVSQGNPWGDAGDLGTAMREAERALTRRAFETYVSSADRYDVAGQNLGAMSRDHLDTEDEIIARYSAIGRSAAPPD
ncbi:hypothetical protein GCM10022224_066800 [Nonomuraea antimicrobica]|uniref:Excreted virulence factor EspC, type VII ESX diderm n=1 Tax=Nonomuraea antimicrobica TaxID=561173 RepID=A0ABP7CNS6_9ACTN